MHPDNKMLMWWQLFMAVPLLYTGTVVPFKLAYIDFRIPNSDGEIDHYGPSEYSWRAVDFFLDILFFMDLISNFFIAYYDVRGVLHSHPAKIWKNYMEGWFWLDLVACVPEELWSLLFTLMLGGGSGSGKHIARLPRMYKILKLSKLIRLSKGTKIMRVVKVMDYNPLVFFIRSVIGQSRLANVAKFVCYLFFMSHILGCAWYMIAALHKDLEITWVVRRMSETSRTYHLRDMNPIAQWLTSTYFVLTVCTTVGFGDISPFSPYEIVFGIFLMILGAIVNSIIVSEVIAVLTRVDAAN